MMFDTWFLDSFAVNNTTHYDFYWYAMWEVDGETGVY